MPDRLALLAGLLALAGCVVGPKRTIDSATDAGTTAAGSSSGGQDGPGATSTSADPTTTTTDVPPDPTVAMTAIDPPPPATASTTDTTGSGGDYGLCGWNDRLKYYACTTDGGVPGTVDPDHISPIDCPAELPQSGDPCSELTPINNVGCCLPDGTNYFCDAQGAIVIDPCGA